MAVGREIAGPCMPEVRAVSVWLKQTLAVIFVAKGCNRVGIGFSIGMKIWINAKRQLKKIS